MKPKAHDCAEFVQYENRRTSLLVQMVFRINAMKGLRLAAQQLKNLRLIPP